MLKPMRSRTWKKEGDQSEAPEGNSWPVDVLVDIADRVHQAADTVVVLSGENRRSIAVAVSERKAADVVSAGENTDAEKTKW
jgi:hypothetical protein